MKLIKKIFVFLLIVLLFTGCESKSKEKEKEKTEEIKPLLYEVTKEGSDNVMYLLGSIHATKKNAFPLPSYIMDAYENSLYLAVECDVVSYMENIDLESYVLSYLYPDGSPVKEHISEETYNKLIEKLKELKLYNENLIYYNTNFFASLLQEKVMEDAKLKEEGIDNFFIEDALSNNKNILEVESVEFQMELLNSFSDRLYELQLLSLLDEYDENVISLKLMYDSWANGDIDKLIELLYMDDDDLSEEDKAIVDDYNNRLVDLRNVTMTNKFMEYFENNYKTFFVVGALHLYGDNGIINGLINNGYSVKAINE